MQPDNLQFPPYRHATTNGLNGILQAPPNHIPHAPPIITPQQALRRTLCEAGIINERGEVDPAVVGRYPLPPLEVEETQALHALMNDVIEMRIVVNKTNGEGFDIAFTLMELCNYITTKKTASPLTFGPLELVGEAIFHLLPSYFGRCVRHLFHEVTGKSEEEIIVDKIIAEVTDTPAYLLFRSIIEQKIDEILNQPTHLSLLKLLIPGFLAMKLKQCHPSLQEDETSIAEKIKNNGLLALFSITGSSTFVLASFGNHKIQVAHQFFKMTHDPLFATDELHLEIRDGRNFAIAVPENQRVAYWQGIIDHMCHMIHGTIPLFASRKWPMLIYYRAKEYTDDGSYHAELYKFRAKDKSPSEQLYATWLTYDKKPRMLVAIALQGVHALRQVGETDAAITNLWKGILENFRQYLNNLQQRKLTDFNWLIESLFSEKWDLRRLVPVEVKAESLELLQTTAAEWMNSKNVGEFLFGFWLLMTCQKLNPTPPTKDTVLKQMPRAIEFAGSVETGHRICVSGQQLLNIAAAVKAKAANAPVWAWILSLGQSPVESLRRLAWVQWGALKDSPEKSVRGVQLIAAYSSSAQAIENLLALQAKYSQRINGELQLFARIIKIYSQSNNRVIATAKTADIHRAAQNTIRRGWVSLKEEKPCDVVSQAVDFMIGRKAWSQAQELLAALCRRRNATLTTEMEQWFQIFESNSPKVSYTVGWNAWLEANKIGICADELKSELFENRVNQFLVSVHTGCHTSKNVAEKALINEVSAAIRIRMHNQKIDDLNTLWSRILVMAEDEPIEQALLLLKPACVANLTSAQHFAIQIRLIERHLEKIQLEQAVSILQGISFEPTRPEDCKKLHSARVQLLKAAAHLPQATASVIEQVVEMLGKDPLSLCTENILDSSQLIIQYLSQKTSKLPVNKKRIIISLLPLILESLKGSDDIDKVYQLLTATEERHIRSQDEAAAWDSWPYILWVVEQKLGRVPYTVQEVKEIYALLKLKKEKIPQSFLKPFIEIYRRATDRLMTSQEAMPDAMLFGIQQLRILEPTVDLNPQILTCQQQFFEGRRYSESISVLNLLNEEAEILAERWMTCIDAIRASDQAPSLLTTLMQEREFLQAYFNTERQQQVAEDVVQKTLSVNPNLDDLNLILDILDKYACKSGSLWLSALTRIQICNDNALKQKAYDIFLRHSEHITDSSERAQCWLSVLRSLASIASRSLLELINLETFLLSFSGEASFKYIEEGSLLLLDGVLQFIGKSIVRQTEQKDLWEMGKKALIILREYQIHRHQKQFDEKLIDEEACVRLCLSTRIAFATFLMKALLAAVGSNNSVLIVDACQTLLVYLQNSSEELIPRELRPVISEMSAAVFKLPQADNSDSLDALMLDILDQLNPHARPKADPSPLPVSRVNDPSSHLDTIRSKALVQLHEDMPAFGRARVILYLDHAFHSNVFHHWERGITYFIENARYLRGDGTSLQNTTKKAFTCLFRIASQPEVDFTKYGDFFFQILESVISLESKAPDTTSYLSQELNIENLHAIFKQTPLMMSILMWLVEECLKVIETTKNECARSTFLILCCKIFGMLLIERKTSSSTLRDLFKKIFYVSPPDDTYERMAFLMHLETLLDLADGRFQMKSIKGIFWGSEELQNEFKMFTSYFNLIARLEVKLNTLKLGDVHLQRLEILLDHVIPQKNLYTLLISFRFLAGIIAEIKNSSASQTQKLFFKLIKAAANMPISDYRRMIDSIGRDRIEVRIIDVATNAVAVNVSGKIVVVHSSYLRRYAEGQAQPLKVSSEMPAFFTLVEMMLSHPEIKDSSIFQLDWKKAASAIFMEFHSTFFKYYQIDIPAYEASFPNNSFPLTMTKAFVEASKKCVFSFDLRNFIIIFKSQMALMVAVYRRTASLSNAEGMMSLIDAVLNLELPDNLKDFRRQLLAPQIETLMSFEEDQFFMLFIKRISQLITLENDIPAYVKLYEKVSARVISYIDKQRATSILTQHHLQDIAKDVLNMICTIPTDTQEKQQCRAQLTSRWIESLTELKAHNVVTELLSMANEAIYPHYPEARDETIAKLGARIAALEAVQAIETAFDTILEAAEGTQDQQG